MMQSSNAKFSKKRYLMPIRKGTVATELVYTSSMTFLDSYFSGHVTEPEMQA